MQTRKQHKPKIEGEYYALCVYFEGEKIQQFSKVTDMAREYGLEGRKIQTLYNAIYTGREFKDMEVRWEQCDKKICNTCGKMKSALIDFETITKHMCVSCKLEYQNGWNRNKKERNKR